MAKTRADLYREWARVIDMCEGAGVDPKFCWKYEGENINGMPYFDSELEQYEFALGIVEGKPVFEADRIWSKRAKMFVLAHQELTINDDCFSWQEQNRTFNLNGIELPCPEKSKTDGYMLSIFHDGRQSGYLFNNYTNRDKVAEQLIRILNDAAEK